MRVKRDKLNGGHRVPRLYLSLVSCLLSLLLSACGFQLRGAAELPPQLERTYVTGLQEHPGFARELAGVFRAAGVTLVESREAATAEFRVRRLVTDRRVLSVGGDARVSEYELFMVLDYEVRGGEWTAEPVTLNITREYVHDPLLVLSQGEQERALRQAMERDLAQLVMFRLQAAH